MIWLQDKNSNEFIIAIYLSDILYNSDFYASNILSPHLYYVLVLDSKIDNCGSGGIK